MQVDLCAEEIGNNVRPAAALLGDVSAVMAQVIVDQLTSLIVITVLSASLMGDNRGICFFFQLLKGVREDGWKYGSDTAWWSSLRDKMAVNAKISKVALAQNVHLAIY